MQIQKVVKKLVKGPKSFSLGDELYHFEIFVEIIVKGLHVFRGL